MRNILTIIAALAFFAAAIPATAMDTETAKSCVAMATRAPELQRAYDMLAAEIAEEEARYQALSIDEKILTSEKKLDLLTVEEGMIATKAGLALCEAIRALERGETMNG